MATAEAPTIRVEDIAEPRRAEAPAAEEAGTIAVVRHATVADVPAIAELVAYYAMRRDLLPRSADDIYQSVREWVVAELNGEIVACASLLVMWADLAEVRSLAVKAGYHGRGLGQAVVRALLADAERLGIRTVFCLTRAVKFFAGIGFEVTERDRFPRKVWKDCIHCPVFANCDEVAMVIEAPGL
jgi:N-acetylglutamate synthase-like GNAT family acetyltransferase